MPLPTEDVPFQALVDVLEICKNARKRASAKQALRHFLHNRLDRRKTDLFQVVRLMLPKFDNKRGNFKIKEAKLVELVLKALSIDQKRGNLATYVKQWKSESTFRGHKLATVLEQVVWQYTC